MKKTIGIHVPTKSRPDRLKVLYDSFLAHPHDQSEFVVGIDKNQKEMYQWVYDTPEIRIIETNGEDYVAKATYMLKQMKEYDYLYLLADDFVLNCDWQTIFLESAVPNCVFYGRDTFANEKLPTAPFIDNKMLQRIGYIAPPTIVHYFADNIWRDWGQAFGTYKYFPNVNVQHLHRVVDPKYNDEVYAVSEPNFNADWAAYDEYVANQLSLDIKKVQDGE